MFSLVEKEELFIEIQTMSNINLSTQNEKITVINILDLLSN